MGWLGCKQQKVVESEFEIHHENGLESIVWLLELGSFLKTRLLTPIHPLVVLSLLGFFASYSIVSLLLLSHV